MVLHGGNDGELTLYGLPEERVFEWTAQELQERIDIGGGERIPTLDQVLSLCAAAPDMLLNIELKSPPTEKWAARYDHDLAARLVVQTVEERAIGS